MVLEEVSNESSPLTLNNPNLMAFGPGGLFLNLYGKCCASTATARGYWCSARCYAKGTVAGDAKS